MESKGVLWLLSTQDTQHIQHRHKHSHCVFVNLHVYIDKLTNTPHNYGSRKCQYAVNTMDSARNMYVMMWVPSCPKGCLE